MKKTTKELLFERMHSIGGMPITEHNFRMPDFSQTLFSLAKKNNGNWQSDKQKNFILSKAEQGIQHGVSAKQGNNYIIFAQGGGDMYGNSYNFDFEINDQGVQKIFKKTGKNNNHTLNWERMDDDKFGEMSTALDDVFKKKYENSILIKKNEEERDRLKGEQKKAQDVFINKLMSVTNKDEFINSEEYKNINLEINKIEKKIEDLKSQYKDLENEFKDINNSEIHLMPNINNRGHLYNSYLKKNGLVDPNKIS